MKRLPFAKMACWLVSLGILPLTAFGSDVMYRHGHGFKAEVQEEAGEIWEWRQREGVPPALWEHIYGLTRGEVKGTSRADCIMAHSYPWRSGGGALHRRIHPDHQKALCR